MKIRLGDLYPVTSGGTPSRKQMEYYEGGTIPWVKTGDLKGKYLYSTNEKISDKGVANSSAKIYPPDTVLLAMYGATIGACSILKIHAATNQACAAFIKNEKVLSEYLFSFLKSKQQIFINDAVGGAQPNISAGYLKNIEIALPTLAEQKKIAAELDKISGLIAKRKSQIEKLDLLVKAKFVEMFGDPVTNPMGWECNSLGQLGDLNRGVSKHRPRNDPKLLSGQFPLIQTGEVAKADLYIEHYTATYSEIGLRQSKLWQQGTLCITIAANIAKTAILKFDACFPDSIVGFLSNNQTNQVFIHYWFGFFQKILEVQAPESAQKNINLKILSDLHVIVPPLVLQSQFADFVEKTEQTKTAMQKSLTGLETLYKARMQEYFE